MRAVSYLNEQQRAVFDKSGSTSPLLQSVFTLVKGQVSLAGRSNDISAEAQSGSDDVDTRVQTARDTHTHNAHKQTAAVPVNTHAS